MHDLPTLAGVFGLSAAKFMMGVALGVGLRLPFALQVASTGGGAVVGIFVTAYLGDGIRALARRKFPRKPKPQPPEGEAPPKPPLAVRVWDRWGLTGLAIIGLGFVVSRFGLFLRAVGHKSPGPPLPLGSAEIGVGLVILGGLVVGGAAWQHVRFCGNLSASERPERYWAGFAVWVALAVSSAAVVLAAYLVQT